MGITLKQSQAVPPAKFTSLAKGRNKVLWGYFGLCDEYPIILSLLKNFLLTSHPEVTVTIAGRDEAKKWTEDLMGEAEFNSSGEDWLDKTEFKTSPAPPHSVVNYARNFPIKSSQPHPPRSGKCGLIVTSNSNTARKLTPDQINQSEKFLSKYGLHPVQCTNPDPDLVRESGAVAGVEHPAVWDAVRDGKPVIVPEYSVGLDLLTKFGAMLFK